MYTQTNTLHRSAVIVPGQVYYGNGTAVSSWRTIATDLKLILAGTLDRFVEHATVVIDGSTMEDLRAQSEAVKAWGWKHSQIDAWTLFHRDDGRTVAVGLRDEMRAPHLGVLFKRDTDPGVLALLLDRYHQATGNAWRGTCATTALGAIRLSWPNKQYQPLWKHAKIPVRSNVGPLSWSRDLNEYEATWGWVHTFDANAAYLGASITAELAWSQLHHVGVQPFDHALPGYWLLNLDTETLAGMRDATRPPLLGKTRDGQVWVTTPYARLLRDLGDRCEVVDSWTGRAELRASGSRLHPAGSRILRTWGEAVRDGLAGMARAGDEVTAVKRTYKDAIGGMQREGMRIYRPDWGHTVVDWWRATLMRRVIAVHETQGIWPVRIATDSVSYADSSDSPEVLAKAIGVRPGLGGFKHEETVTTQQWCDRHKKGGRR